MCLQGWQGSSWDFGADELVADPEVMSMECPVISRYVRGSHTCARQHITACKRRLTRSSFYNGQAQARTPSVDPHAAPLNKLFDKYRGQTASFIDLHHLPR